MNCPAYDIGARNVSDKKSCRVQLNANISRKVARVRLLSRPPTGYDPASRSVRPSNSPVLSV
jgi:hypothetical protein